MVNRMCRPWIQLLVFLGGFMVPSVLPVRGLEVYTAAEVVATNGTTVKLKCTFSSKHPVFTHTVSVSWNFRPLRPGSEESVFYYQEEPYPPTSGRFKGHAMWSGDILRNDASITLHEVRATFNGTYICQVRNLPDVHSRSGEVVLKVVTKVSLSDISILAIVVGSAIGVVLLCLSIFMFLKFSRGKLSEMDIEHVAEHSRGGEWKESKDPTDCKPEEAVHLKLVEKEKEVESSDEESEASSGDDQEEDGGNDDDDDDDDDDGGGDDDD